MSQLTDILIPLGQGSRHGNIELRYCLRAIEKHLTGVGNIFIVGECPEWVAGVVHIPCSESDNSCNRAHNIYSKIIAGLPHVTDNFLFMNDDHFLLADYDAATFPYYHRGLIVPGTIGSEAQRVQMQNTIHMLGVGDHRDFDIHCPILYNKADFVKCFASLAWPDHGYGIKSMYANWAMEIGEQMDDLKFSEPLLADTIIEVLASRKWFSIGDKVLRNGEMQKVLEGLYPTPSKYEKI